MKEIKELLNIAEVQRLKEVLGEEADLHLVGGVVRDTILGKKPKDIDLATRLTPDEMLVRFNRAGIGSVPTGIRRGTMTALVDGEPIEITTFRNYKDENTFTDSIEEDLSARDLTINAIAVSVNTGEIVDPFDGLDDLENGIVRAVGDANVRFTEDPHRIIRMVRFGAASGRMISPLTLLAAHENFHLVADVAIERINAEFIKIMTSEFPVEALKLLIEIGFMDMFIPELLELDGVKQNHWHIHDVLGHTLKVVEHTPRNRILRVAALLHDIGKPASLTVGDDGVRHFIGHELAGLDIAERILERLKFTNSDKKVILKLIRNHMRPTDGGGRSIRKTMAKLGEHFDLFVQLKKADRLGGKLIENFEEEWQKFLDRVEKEKNRKVVAPFDHLNISGNDIIKLGIKQGPEVGRVLKELQELVLEEPEINNRETLIEIAKGLV
jgi:tRNA nucleotidyltransferase (CCA-adding enzyme)